MINPTKPLQPLNKVTINKARLVLTKAGGMSKQSPEMTKLMVNAY